MIVVLRVARLVVLVAVVGGAALLGSATPAAAQAGGGAPTEPTISQLREGLQQVLGIERQR